MREIKFRAWDKEEKKFLEPCFESEEDRYNKGKAIIRWNSSGKIWITLSGYRDEDNNPYQIDAEIMQYTGLKDKNGKEIYEDDIVKSSIGAIQKVYYNNKFAAFLCKDIYRPNGELSETWIIEVDDEVIGNIYQNPDLLESEEK